LFIAQQRVILMSFLKKLFGFGGRNAADEATPAADPVEYKGFTIRAAPYKSEGQYQVAGVIEKEIDGTRHEHRFIRADRHAAIEDATEIALAKARLIVDEQGERMFK
jgi:hypothetical protein